MSEQPDNTSEPSIPNDMPVTPTPIPVVPDAKQSSDATESASEAVVTQPAAQEALAAEPTAEAATDVGATESKEGGKPEAEKAPPPNPALYRAMRSRRPVKGKVDAVIKGGYEIKIPKARGFCPASQIDIDRVTDPETFVGKTLEFRVIQIRSGGKDVVLSRRAVMESGRVEEAKAVRATLVEGSILQGHVVGLADFGAFVDLGAGVRGLVHLSELSHARVDKAGDAVQEGAAVQVKILKIDKKKDRISLSIKQAQGDPWTQVAGKYAEGTQCEGTVRRLADFGLFVELEPGIEALAPASEFPPERLGWQSTYQPGLTGKWTVLAVQPGRRRISLRPVLAGDADVPTIEAGQTLTGRVQRVEKFGIFVWLAPGQVGLMPNMWSGSPRGADVSLRYPIGESVEVQVVEVEEDGKRIRLAKKGIDTKAMPATKHESRDRHDDPASKLRRPMRTEGGPVSDGAKGSFGASLADKLRAALEGNK